MLKGDRNTLCLPQQEGEVKEKLDLQGTSISNMDFGIPTTRGYSTFSLQTGFCGQHRNIILLTCLG